MPFIHLTYKPNKIEIFIYSFDNPNGFYIEDKKVR